MSNNKKYGGSGYYIALIACAAAIGITGYLYYRNASEPDVSLQQQESNAIIAPVEEQQDVEAVATQGSTPVESTDPTQPIQKKTIKTGAPLAGQTISGYAMETLSYNQTTRDWRTHNGIDIAAEAGTPVLAAADGTVYTVYEDDSMGTTVVIRHEDGYTTQYSSLASELSVSVGDTVKLGQQIGCVGETALLETAIGPHVHFCVLYLDEPMDPAEFLAMN
ncbi:MAG: M23 family metallopeptidase [Oscillospiraceae bacterium]|nr:M23 family metallopeptidase [Oscillospiraceae bacterium]